MECKVGQILTLKEDQTLELGISGRKKFLPKGHEIIIGADKMAHHIEDGKLQLLSMDTKIDGYDTSGLSKYIYERIKNNFEIEAILDEWGYKSRFIEIIKNALDELGF